MGAGNGNEPINRWECDNCKDAIWKGIDGVKNDIKGMDRKLWAILVASWGGLAGVLIKIVLG